MIRFVTITLFSACLLLGGSLLSPLEGVAGGKPLLSVAIRKAIDTKGVEAAKKQFEKEYATNKNKYQVDRPGVMAQAKAYAQARNSPAMSAMLSISMPFLYDSAMAKANTKRNAQATQRAAQYKALSAKTRAMQKVRIKEHQEAQKKQAAEKKAADARRVARYEAQRKPYKHVPGALPPKLSSEDKWYLVRTLNVDAKGVSIMKFPADLHKAALAAGFKGRMAYRGSAYTKGPIRIIADFDPGRNLIKKMRYELRDLPPAQWQAYTRSITRQLGSAGPRCQRRGRLQCNIGYDARNYYAMVEIKSYMRQDKGFIRLVFHQGP